jgi:fatty-acid desaturase
LESDARKTIVAATQTAKPHWPVGIGLAFIHLGALAAFWPPFFHWSALAVFAVLWYATLAIGVSLCFHRMLTHKSLRVPKLLEYAMAVLGTLALEGGPIQWVATHRIHHAHTDREGDPHDARRGLFWSHFEWLYRPNEARPTAEERVRYAPDLVSQPFYRFLDAAHVPLQIALGVMLFALGGWSWLIWGVFVRLTVVYHITWFVNSAAHRFGYQSFRTGDRSTNCWWVALLTFGEGWHNNHHAFPFSARHGLKWYEVDLSWMTIRLLRLLRLAKDVKLPTPAMLERLENRLAPPESSRADAARRIA